ncbi:MAG: phosphopantothenoylcysteine decarboxylase [Planctomycetota bacterium]
MRVLISGGATREPIDAVRFVGNRSSGRLGVALFEAAGAAGHEATLVMAAAEVAVPASAVRVETTDELLSALTGAWPTCDVLIMAAAVADFRPVRRVAAKLRRTLGNVTLEMEPTVDVLGRLCEMKRPDQRVVGFKLEDDIARAREKFDALDLDLLVFNPLATMGASGIEATLIDRAGESSLGVMSKEAFAGVLVARACSLK